MKLQLNVPDELMAQITQHDQYGAIPTRHWSSTTVWILTAISEKLGVELPKEPHQLQSERRKDQPNPHAPARNDKGRYRPCIDQNL